jgi:hypothetical protein
MWPFLQTPNTSCGCEQSGTNQCGCDKISSLDVSYNGPALVCSGIELCDSLTVALQKIEAKICTAGNISGSGINNYVARWNPNGNTLSTGLIRDDGVSTAINTAPNPDVLLRTHTFLHGYANYTSLSRVSNENNIGIKSLTLSSTDTNIGIQGIGSGKDNNINIGINGIGTGISDDAGTAITIGGKFEAYDTSLGNSYAVQLYDGSQGVGKFLKSVTNDGHANWANIVVGDIKSGTSTLGQVITSDGAGNSTWTTPTSSGVDGTGTLNRIAKWTDADSLGNSQIIDDGANMSINSGLVGNTKLIISSDKVFGLSVQQTVQGIAGQYYATVLGTSSNTGIQGRASGSTTANTGGDFLATGTGTDIAIGGTFSAASGASNYSLRLQDGTQGIGKVLTSVTANGEANWVTPISGSGTNNYVARWTPSGTQLGIGVIRDDNTSVGIYTVPDTETRLSVGGGSLRGIYAFTTRVSTPSDVATGTYSESGGVGSSGENVGVLGTASNNTNVNYGVYGGCSGTTTGKNIGLRGVASAGAAGNYAIQLQDGTQAAGKFLKSITNNGEANWANITSSDTTGATGSFTSQDGKTITVTNGLITSII